jgi:hypothetical protein
MYIHKISLASIDTDLVNFSKGPFWEIKKSTLMLKRK